MKKKTLGQFLSTEINRRIKRDTEWYVLRGMLSYSWAMLFFLLGGREAGKSYAVTDFYVHQWKTKGRPFYWLRLSQTSAAKLLMNNAEKLVDPDIRRRWNLDLVTVGDAVYEVTKRGKQKEDGRPGKIIEKKLMARVLDLSTFYNDKGSGLFDKDFLNDPDMYYNLALDEMNRETGSTGGGERRNFDIAYAFANQVENLIRSTKSRVRIICIGNTLEEASDLLTAINFIPETFGRYKIKSKRAVVEYIEPSKKYLERRKGTVADIISGNSSTFTNKIDVDRTLVTKQRLRKPSYIVAFTNTEKYTIWDGNVVAQYNNERCGNTIAMRPYLDFTFETKSRDTVMNLFDTRAYRFRNLVTQKLFKKNLELLKPRK